MTDVKPQNERFICRACGHVWERGEESGTCTHPARHGRHETYTWRRKGAPEEKP